MSSATVDVLQYETAAKLSEAFERALVDLITVHHRLPGHTEITPQRCEGARTAVADILFAMERALTGEWGDTHALGRVVPDLPDGIAAWLQASHQGEAVTPSVLAGARQRLQQEPFAVGDGDIEMLQRLARVLDAQTEHLFRRLPRTAGSV